MPSFFNFYRLGSRARGDRPGPRQVPRGL